VELSKRLLVPTVLILFGGTAAADATLSAKPNKCVSLNKGQVCYQRIELAFVASTQGDYCIYRSDQTQPLQCFEKTREGVTRVSFESSKDMQFVLKDSELKSVASSIVEVAWVYKRTRKRSRWRLF